MDTQIRKMQLVAREGVLFEIMETWDFPTPNHKRVIELLYQETIEEIQALGLTREE